MSQAFLVEVRKVMALAESKFDVDLSDVAVQLNIRGYRTAGQAGWKKRSGITTYRLRFHPLAISKYYDHMVKDVIPHEVAHMVCYKNPSLGRNHNWGWKSVCRALGGSAERLHDMNLDEARLGRTSTSKKFEYRCENGETIVLGLGRHRSLQSGKYLSYSCSRRGKIKASGFLRKVAG